MAQDASSGMSSNEWPCKFLGDVCHNFGKLYMRVSTDLEQSGRHTGGF